MSEITEAQLQLWERIHVRRGEYGSVLGKPICDEEVDELGTYSVRWPCPVSLLIGEVRALRAAREPAGRALCNRCGQPVDIEFNVPNDVFEAAGFVCDGDYVCIRCFDKQAAERGVRYVARFDWAGEAGVSEWREPAGQAVIEAAVEAVTAWRTMNDERNSVDQWWDTYAIKRDALVDAVDAYIVAAQALRS